MLKINKLKVCMNLIGVFCVYFEIIVKREVILEICVNFEEDSYIFLKVFFL